MKRIALDTGVARELCYEEPAWFQIFVQMASDGWSFHLTDISVGEIIAARERNSIKETEWTTGVSRLSELLIGEFPCLPGKRDLFHLCGFRDEEDPNTEILLEESLRTYSQAAWETLKQPLQPTGTGAEVVFTVGTQKFKCPIKLGQAVQVLEDERNKWIDEMTRPPQSDFNYESKVAEIKSDFDSWAKTDGLPMSIRGDILAHVQAEWERRLASGYKASSPKRRNDGIDFLLHFTFMWPALLVTTDQSVKDFMRSLQSFQASWIFLPQDLANAWSEKSLVTPDWQSQSDCKTL